jgi:hypothetical protein
MALVLSSRAASPRARRVVASLGAVAATWLLPGLAAACTVCMGGQEEASRKAFVGTTAFLTFFPLLVLAVGVGWFVRRTLAQEREEEARDRVAALRPAERHEEVRALR